MGGQYTAPVSNTVLLSKQALIYLLLQTHTQRDYYGRRCGTLLCSYCTGTYTEVTMLLL